MASYLAILHCVIVNSLPSWCIGWNICQTIT